MRTPGAAITSVLCSLNPGGIIPAGPNLSTLEDRHPTAMTTADPQFEGVYGKYSITEHDRRDVQRYRISLLVSGLAMSRDWCSGGSWAAAGLGSGCCLSPAVLACP